MYTFSHLYRRSRPKEKRISRTDRPGSVAGLRRRPFDPAPALLHSLPEEAPVEASVMPVGTCLSSANDALEGDTPITRPANSVALQIPSQILHRPDGLARSMEW